MLSLRSLGKFLSPYSKTCMRASLELLTYPCGRNRAKTPVRRSLRGTAKEGQSNKKWFCILDAIVRWAQWVYSVPKIMLEFVKV